MKTLIFFILGLTQFNAFADLANTTPVHDGTEYRQISHYIPGDLIIALTLNPEGSMNASRKKVLHTLTSGEHARTQLLRITYSDKEILASKDQVFLLDNGKFILARELVPGKHHLKGASNVKSHTVTSVAVGEFNGGVHNISVESENLYDHLIVANDVIVGDFLIQMNYDSKIPDTMKEYPTTPGHPEI